MCAWRVRGRQGRERHTVTLLFVLVHNAQFCEVAFKKTFYAIVSLGKLAHDICYPTADVDADVKLPF